MTSWPSMRPAYAHMDTAVGRLVDGAETTRRARQHADLFMSRQRRQRRERTRRPATRARSRRPPIRRSTAASRWATLENTPFRRYKHFNHEGGIATPLIVHWPRGIAGARANSAQQPGHLIDIMADLRGRGGREVSDRVQRPNHPADGRPQPRAGVCNHRSSATRSTGSTKATRAVRVGDWKLVRMDVKGPWELYDMKTDRTELHDLAGQQPAMCQETCPQSGKPGPNAPHVKPYPPAKPAQKKTEKPAAASAAEKD